MVLKALLHGKLIDEFTRSPFSIEDLLTSVAIGSCAYVSPHIALLPFLRLARTIEGDTLANALADVVNVEMEFWPSWDALSGSPATGDLGVQGAEPEVVLQIQHSDGRRSVLLIEVKLHAGKSSHATDGGAVSDQLAKYWLHLVRHAARIQASALGIVYVTKALSLPTEEFDASQLELRIKGHAPGRLYWVSWRRFTSAINAADSPLLRDVIALMHEHWNLGEVEMAPWPAPLRPPAPWTFTSAWEWDPSGPLPAWSFQP